MVICPKCNQAQMYIVRERENSTSYECPRCNWFTVRYKPQPYYRNLDPKARF